MIYTVTLNPTIDHTMRFSRVVIGALNRAHSARVDLSGKGINVSMALRRFGVESVVMGFAAGTFGRLLVDGLAEQGYSCDFVQVQGRTRSNVTVIDESTGVTTKLNEPGPSVTEDDLRALEERLLSRIVAGDTCVFSGNLPPGAPANTYARLIAAVHSRGARAALDTSGEALTAGCAAEPDLVKPNADEASALVLRPFDEPAAWVHGVQAVLALGPQRVLLSLGSRGAVFADGTATDGAIWWGEPPAITEVSAVGAGDALMAAGLWAWSEQKPTEEIIRWAVASGTAAAMEDGSAMPTRARIEQIYAQVKVTCLQTSRGESVGE